MRQWRLVFLALYWFMQPRVISNPGMAAHFAPAATRIEPLLRKMDAPELAEVLESSPRRFRAGQLSSDQSGKADREVQAPVRKRPRTVVRREQQQPAYGYAQQPGYGYAQQGNGGYQPGRWF
jgi:hypothetical protein